MSPVPLALTCDTPSQETTSQKEEVPDVLYEDMDATLKDIKPIMMEIQDQ